MCQNTAAATKVNMVEGQNLDNTSRIPARTSVKCRGRTNCLGIQRKQHFFIQLCEHPFCAGSLVPSLTRCSAADKSEKHKKMKLVYQRPGKKTPPPARSAGKQNAHLVSANTPARSAGEKILGEQITFWKQIHLLGSKYVLGNKFLLFSRKQNEQFYMF